MGGIGRAGRLVTCVALLLFLCFATVANGGELDGAILASGIALGINLDATLIPTPTVVAMMGRSWWLPVWAARALRVPASPPRDEPPEPAVARGITAADRG